MCKNMQDTTAAVVSCIFLHIGPPPPPSSRNYCDRSHNSMMMLKLITLFALLAGVDAFQSLRFGKCRAQIFHLASTTHHCTLTKWF